MIVLPPRALPALTVIVREFKFTCGTVGYAQLSVVNDMPVPIKPGTKTYEMLNVNSDIILLGDTVFTSGRFSAFGPASITATVTFGSSVSRLAIVNPLDKNTNISITEPFA